jgi:hypothetical protein
MQQHVLLVSAQYQIGCIAAVCAARVQEMSSSYLALRMYCVYYQLAVIVSTFAAQMQFSVSACHQGLVSQW